MPYTEEKYENAIIQLFEEMGTPTPTVRQLIVTIGFRCIWTS